MTHELQVLVTSSKRKRTYTVTSALDRFWRYVQITDSCWLWKGAACNGYGRFHPRPNKQMLATHFSYELANKCEVPIGKYLCHHCDTPECVRPDHLFVGTQQDNILDMDQKGRRRCADQKGIANGNAKLSQQDVRAIRHLYFAERRTQQEIADLFGVKQAHVSRVARVVMWQEEV